MWMWKLWDNVFAWGLRSSYWLNDYLKGSKIRSHYSKLKKHHASNTPASTTVKRDALQNLLRHASEHSEFYRGTDYSSLNNFPIVNKKILIDNHDRNIVPAHFLPWQNGNYVIQRTSGSTGTPFCVPMDSRKRERRVAELKYFGKVVGFNSHDKLMQLRIWSKWQTKSKSRQRKENITAWDISNQSDSQLTALYNALNKERSVCIRGYASSIDLLAKHIKKHKLLPPHYLRIAIAGSEPLYPETRNLVETYMRCNIISQYANEENGILAQQRIDNKLNGGFEINDSSYVIEVLKMKSDEPAEYGELGRIVITDLYNYAFPMIRYENGDCGVLEKSADGIDYFSKIYGRVMDLVYDGNGEPVNPMTLNRILKNYPSIAQWQFIQKSASEYLLKIIPSDKTDNTLQTSMIDELKSYFGINADIRIEYVDVIPVLKSGKRKSVVCEWSRP